MTFRSILVALVLLVNLVLAQPVWADPPKLTATPEYTEVTEAIDHLLQIKASPDQTDLQPEAIERQLGELNLQKYILESAKDWAQCRNETGKTLAVYAHKGKTAAAPALYYLADGQTTDDDWNCDGIYLPTGTKVAGLFTDPLTEPLALKVTSGAQFVAKANPTGELAFNLNPAKILKAGEGNLPIPDLAQTAIDGTKPNAPIED
ncbi:MAG: hypothetical protein ACAF41_05265 [Leptolyngbya sp. BL-A-14]